DDDCIAAVETVGMTESSASELHQRLLGLRAHDIPLGRRLIDGRAPVVVVDPSGSDLVPAVLLEDMTVGSYVAMPLTTSSGVVGAVLFSSSTTQRRWSRADRALTRILQPG